MQYDKQLRILQIGESWTSDRIGGMNRYFASLVTSLLESGIKVKGLVIGSTKAEEITRGAVKSFGFNKGNLLSKFLMIHNYFKKNVNVENFDVIVSHFSLFTFPLLPLFKNKPLIIHFHGPFAFEGEVEKKKSLGNFAKYYIEKTVYNRGCNFITLSRAFKNILAEKYKIDPKKIEVIPGGVDCNKFSVNLSREEARKKLNLPQNRPIIVAVRRIVKRMGLENLIESIKTVKDSHPDVLLLIAGKGVLLEELNQRIISLGLEENVRMLGFVPDEDLPVLYRAANLSIVPTVELEGFGLIVLESLASGTPVLVTPIGGLPETIEKFRPDLILSSSSIESLSKGINDALSGKLKLPLQEECINYVKNNHDWTIISKQIYEFYEKFM